LQNPNKRNPAAESTNAPNALVLLILIVHYSEIVLENEILFFIFCRNIDSFFFVFVAQTNRGVQDSTQNTVQYEHPVQN
jgi:hypothetical protein